MYDVSEGFKLHGRFTSPVPTSQGPIGTIGVGVEGSKRQPNPIVYQRHLSACNKGDIRVLFDLKPDIECVCCASGSVPLGSRITWADFQQKFPISVDVGISHIRHFVAGRKPPWDSADDGSAQAAGSRIEPRGSGQLVPVSGSSSSAGQVSQLQPASDVESSRKSLLNQMLDDIEQAAKAGDMARLQNRLGLVRTAVDLPKTTTSRQDRERKKNIGGVTYRPDFLLHAVRLCEHLSLGHLQPNRQWVTARTNCCCCCCCCCCCSCFWLFY